METPCAVLDHVPPEFLESSPERLIEVLPQPTLFDLKGRDPRPLFVSTLLHGDEETGLEAAQALLRRHLGKGLNRSLLLFVGNVEAAAAGVRTLPNQRDFNRIWPGTALSPDHQTKMAQFVYDYAARRPLFATSIFTTTPASIRIMAASRGSSPSSSLWQGSFRAPSFILSVPSACKPRPSPGFLPRSPSNAARSARARPKIMRSDCWKPASPLRSFRSTRRRPRPQSSAHLRDLACRRRRHSLRWLPGRLHVRRRVDHLNFSELTPGATFGRLGNGVGQLELAPGEGAEAQPVGYFDYANGEIRLARSAIPAMLTTKPAAVRQDCLCYLMHRIDMQGERL